MRKHHQRGGIRSGTETPLLRCYAEALGNKCAEFTQTNLTTQRISAAMEKKYAEKDGEEKTLEISTGCYLCGWS
jgi:hypothetical protein